MDEVEEFERLEGNDVNDGPPSLQVSTMLVFVVFKRWTN